MRCLTLLTFGLFGVACGPSPYAHPSMSSSDDIFSISPQVADDYASCAWNDNHGWSDESHPLSACRSILDEYRQKSRFRAAVAWYQCHHLRIEKAGYCGNIVDVNWAEFSRDERARMIEFGATACDSSFDTDMSETSRICSSWYQAATRPEMGLPDDTLQKYRRQACFFGYSDACDNERDATDAKQGVANAQRNNAELQQQANEDRARMEAEEEAAKLQRLQDQVQKDCGGFCPPDPSSGASSAKTKPTPNRQAGKGTECTPAPDPVCGGGKNWCPPSACNGHHGFCAYACDACYAYDSPKCQ